MVTYVQNEFRGLSTDTKPTNAINGQTFLEIDTGKMWIYDAENSQWIDYTAPADEVSY